MTSHLPTEGLRVKYRARNPAVRRLMHGFLRAFDRSVRRVEADRIVEIGCGEAFLAHRMLGLQPGARVVGLDASAEILAIARREFPRVALVLGTAYGLPFADASADLVVACEVLEHLEAPERALAEIARVSRAHALFSVPREPLWRVLNVLRGRYWTHGGNTPGHLRHWTPRAFVEFVESRFRVTEVRHPLPWTMVLCAKREAAAPPVPGSS